MHFFRLLHSSAKLMSSALPIEKSALAKLRKATGYSFSKCKEALVKHENDLKLAEKWLKDEAQAHGWEKATKLQGRSTAQGLISVLSSPSNAVIFEVNCETDFVARNKKFEALVTKIASGLFSYSNSQPLNSPHSKTELSGEELSNLTLADSNRLVKDEIAVSIGEIGENMVARRAICFRSSSEVLLAGYTHPASSNLNGAQFGKYGALVAVKSTQNLNEAPIKELTLIGRQLCQHIVGMNPKEIGSMDVPPPEEKDEKIVDSSRENLNGEESSENNEEILSKKEEKDEEVLLNQEFLLDPDMTVREFLLQNNIQLLDFVRFECGQNLDSSSQ